MRSDGLHPVYVLAALLAALLLFVPVPSKAEVSSNIPLESRFYTDIEYLEVRGFIKSAMLSTRPFSRTEGVRLVMEAQRRWDSLNDAEKERAARAGRVIERLVERFASSALEGADGGSYNGLASLAPGNVYARYAYSGNAPFFINRNNNGDVMRKGSNLRAGFDAELSIFGAASLYLNPEYRAGDGVSSVELVRGYAMADIGNFEMEIGRDSMWWGSGQNGALLISNNAEPLEMIKLTSATPFVLPWIFRGLGIVKPTVFLARLEADRKYPHTNLLGMRLDMKPTSGFQIGLNRVFMFGGEGRRSLTLMEWAQVFIASDTAEHADSPINGNQIASIDASYVRSFESRYVPFSGMKIYTEWGAEDSSGKTRTPTGRANIYGAFLTDPLWLADVDLRVEWANTGRNERYGPLWYEHSVYSTGYRYKGRVIGHQIGGDAQDLFVRLQYHTNGGMTIGVEYEQLKTGVHSASPVESKWYEADFLYEFNNGLSVSALCGFEERGGTDDSLTSGISINMAW